MELYDFSNPIADNFVVDVDQGVIGGKTNKIIQQGEHNARHLQVELVQNGVPVDLTNCDVYFLTRLLKSENTPTMTVCEIFNEEKGHVKVAIKNYMTSTDGVIECEFVRIGHDKTVLPFKKFNLTVDGSIYTDDAIEASEPLHALVEALATVREVEQHLGAEFMDLEAKYAGELSKTNAQLSDRMELLKSEMQTEIDNTNTKLSEEIDKSNQTFSEALAKIEETELVRLKELIELLQQNKLGVNDKAADSALLNGVSEDVEATADTIVKRDFNKNIKTGHQLLMNLNGLEQSLELLEGSHLKIGERNLWDNDNLVIESGTWTPVLKKDGITSFTMDGGTYGLYFRIGELVYVQGRAKATGKNGISGGKLTISELPFSPKNSGQSIQVGLHSGMTYHAEAKNIATYLQANNPLIQFYYTRSDASYQVWNCDNVSETCDIYFSGVYRVN